MKINDLTKIISFSLNELILELDEFNLLVYHVNDFIVLLLVHDVHIFILIYYYLV